MVVIRSPHPHAYLRSFNIDCAKACSGVLAVLTGVDCIRDGLAPIPHNPLPSTKHDMKLHGPGNSNVFLGEHTLLPVDRTRYVGEALAIVIADSLVAAQEGAEFVDIEYETKPSVAVTPLSAASDAPTIWNQ